MPLDNSINIVTMQKVSTLYGMTEICVNKFLGFMQSFSNILEIICVWNQYHHSIFISARPNGTILKVNVIKKWRYVKNKELTYSMFKQSGIFQYFQLFFNPLSNLLRKFCKTVANALSEIVYMHIDGIIKNSIVFLKPVKFSGSVSIKYIRNR